MGGGAALGVLAGWQGSEVARLQTEFEEARLPWTQRVEDYLVPGETAAQASNGLLGSAIAVGTGGAVALIVSLATRKGAGPVAFAVPQPAGGFTFVLGGAW